MSTTGKISPPKELINLHQTFWKDYIEKELSANVWDGQRDEETPSLDVYVVDLWPAKLQGLTI
jgi:hypothetical protein